MSFLSFPHMKNMTAFTKISLQKYHIFQTVLANVRIYFFFYPCSLNQTCIQGIYWNGLLFPLKLLFLCIAVMSVGMTAPDTSTFWTTLSQSKAKAWDIMKSPEERKERWREDFEFNQKTEQKTEKLYALKFRSTIIWNVIVYSESLIRLVKIVF